MIQEDKDPKEPDDQINLSELVLNENDFENFIGYLEDPNEKFKQHVDKEKVKSRKYYETELWKYK